MFLSTDLSASTETNRYQDIITDAIEVEFRNAGYSIIPREDWRAVQTEMKLSSVDVILGANAIKLSRRIEADYAVTGFYKLESNRLLLEIKCYDVKQGRLVAGVLQSGRLGLSTYNLINDVVSKILPELEAALVPLPPLERLPDERLHEVTLLSNDEDAEVYLSSEVLMGSIRNGAVSQIVVKDSELIIEIRKEEYHSRREVIKQQEGEDNYSLPDLMKQTRWASEFLYTSGQALGIGLARRPCLPWPRSDGFEKVLGDQLANLRLHRNLRQKKQVRNLPTDVTRQCVVRSVAGLIVNNIDDYGPTLPCPPTCSSQEGHRAYPPQLPRHFG